MEKLLVQLTDDLVAQVSIYYAAPAHLVPNYDGKCFEAHYKGQKTILDNSGKSEKFFTKVFEDIKGEIKPTLSSVKFLQPKYKKEPFILPRLYWDMIMREVALFPAKRFKNPAELQTFCEPDYGL